MPEKDYRQDTDFREFVRWSALPKWRKNEEGLPMTKTEWAEERGYNRWTLWNWEQTEAYDEMMEEIVKEWLGDSIPQVVAAAKEVATNPKPGGHKDRKLLLELAGMAGQKMTIRHEGSVEHNHTLEEVRTMDEAELRSAMRADLRKRPRFAEVTDEELDELIDAFLEANVGGGPGPDALPGEAGPARKDPDYLLADPPDDLAKASDD